MVYIMPKELKDRITILTTTHYKASAHRIESTYKTNHDRTTTDTTLISDTINDLYKMINCDNIRHIISLDHDDKDEGSNLYLDNLNTLAKEYKNIEIITTTDGIYHSIKNLTHNIDTDYYLWWEHDWKFLNSMELSRFIEIMDKYDYINYIRFNKRENINVGCDRILKTADDISEMDLLITNGWSNNPYFGRASKMLCWYELMETSMNDWNTYKNFHPTIERTLQEKMRADIDKLGIDEASKEWGVFIYGKLNGKQRVLHTNGKDK